MILRSSIKVLSIICWAIQRRFRNFNTAFATVTPATVTPQTVQTIIKAVAVHRMAVRSSLLQQ